MRVLFSVLIASIFLTACSTPTPGPDKTIAGTVLGAGWGAGAGAIIGNQLEFGPVGQGAAIGAGFGALSGALSGAMYDSVEDTQLTQEKELAALQVQSASNRRQLKRLQQVLDSAVDSDGTGGLYQVFFDTDATDLRSGALSNLEVIAESIKTRTRGYYVNVVGHSDDSGKPGYNTRLAAARARTVTAYLSSRGISMDQIRESSKGAKRPIASNGTPIGRQLNRRVDIYITAK